MTRGRSYCSVWADTGRVAIVCRKHYSESTSTWELIFKVCPFGHCSACLNDKPRAAIVQTQSEYSGSTEVPSWSTVVTA